MCPPRTLRWSRVPPAPPPPGVHALGPVAICLDFLLPFKEAARPLAASRLPHSRSYTWNPSPAVGGASADVAGRGLKIAGRSAGGRGGQPGASPAGVRGPCAGPTGHCPSLVWQKWLLTPHPDPPSGFGDGCTRRAPPGHALLDWRRRCGSRAGDPCLPHCRVEQDSAKGAALAAGGAPAAAPQRPRMARCPVSAGARVGRSVWLGEASIFQAPTLEDSNTLTPINVP